jgi:tetraacyldisaccharide 4'-kinase
MNALQILLLPFSWIYGWVVRFRNHLFNIEYTKSFSFDIPVVVVGNLTVGGTGKTPMVEYLLRLCSEAFHPAVLSRGYKRNTRGFVLADENSTAQTIGDEPLQYHLKFSTPVAVCEDRVEAIPKILFEAPDTDLIIMDDGYQHRAVNPFLALILTDCKRPFYDDFLLPSGRLREPRKEVRRCDAVIVTKCDADIATDKQEKIISRIHQYKSGVPVFFSTIAYGEPELLFGEGLPSKQVVLLTGIADGASLKKHIATKWEIVSHAEFPDHHAFSKSDLEQTMQLALKKDAVILTTEKDAARLRQFDLNQLPQGINVFFIPIRSRFIKNGSDFDLWFLNQLQSFAS